MTALNLAEPKITDLLTNLVSAAHFDLTFSLRSHPGSVPEVTVEFSGPDTPLLTARNGELLRALEHLTAKVLGLESEQHDLLSFDADRFKQTRDHALAELAREAAATVAATREPFLFSPMSSHERRLLHLTLTEMGLRTVSTGEGPQRAVVLYPSGLPHAEAGNVRDPQGD